MSADSDTPTGDELQEWVVISKVVCTVCACLVATSLIVNYTRFKGRINSCASLITYYVAAMISLIMDVCTCWTLT